MLGALLVQDRARVDLLRHAVRDAGREVRLDHPGDDVDARALGRENDVHARRSRFLRQTRDRHLDLFALLHHEIREFIHHDDDERQLLRECATPSSACQRAG